MFKKIDFEKSGEKIKKMSYLFFRILLFFNFVCALAVIIVSLGYMNKITFFGFLFSVLIAAAVFVFLYVLSYVFCLLMHGFGELIDNTEHTRKYTKKAENFLEEIVDNNPTTESGAAKVD